VLEAPRFVRLLRPIPVYSWSAAMRLTRFVTKNAFRNKRRAKSSVEATIDTTTLSTGVVMRDNTLKSETSSTCKSIRRLRSDRVR
jgi:hypothetical protein